MNPVSRCVGIFGSQYGDEAKGKLVYEYISHYSETEPEIVCVRFNGGSNAGHSIYLNGVLFDTHILPSGILNQKTTNIIGTGVIVNPSQLFDELFKLKQKTTNLGKVYISDRSHITLLLHKYIDYIEGKQFGSTGSGISQTIGDKANRRGIQFHQFCTDNWKQSIIKLYEYYFTHFSNYFEQFSYKIKCCGNEINFSSKESMLSYELDFIDQNINELRNMITNTMMFMNSLSVHTPIIFEGANSIMLDPNVGYPNCTATFCTIGGLLSGSDITMKFLQQRNFKIIGVCKGYITRVGTGTLITEDFGEDGSILQRVGNEFGTTTGRKRRTGWFDIPLLKYTKMINDFDYINMTKLDVMSSFEKVKICIGYIDKTTGLTLKIRSFNDIESENYEPIYHEMDGWKDWDISNAKCWDDLHPNIKSYIKYIEQEIEIPVVYINTGREHGMTISNFFY